MKKIFLLLIFTLVIGNAFADESHKFYRWLGHEMTGDTSEVPLKGYVLAAGSQETWTQDFDTERPQGFAALQLTISGSGTLRIYHTSSIAGGYYSPAVLNGSATDDIVTALTAGSGYYAFPWPLARYTRLNFLETGGANTVTIDKIEFMAQ